MPFMDILTTEKQAKLQIILLNFLEGAKLKNPSFGLRALALKLQMSPGALSEIISGKRRISLEKTHLILNRLTVDPEVSKSLFDTGLETLENELERSSIQLSLDNYHVLTEWHFFAILNLIETKGFKNDPKIIAKRLGLSVDTVKLSFERLFRLGMIEIKRGKLKRTTVRFKTSEDITNTAIKKFHQNALMKAEEALDFIPTTERDFSAMVLPLAPEKLNKIKEKIRKFQNQLLAECSDGNATEVFQVSMQVFPLSRSEEKRDQ